MAYFGDVKKAAEATYPGSQDHYVRLANRILQGLDVVCVRSMWEVRTEANPGSEVVMKLLASVGLDPSLGLDAAAWSAMKVFIDEKVVRDRNLVAHGDGLTLAKDEFLERTARMIDLMEGLSATVLTAAEKRSYRA
jgi:hypothetical protein